MFQVSNIFRNNGLNQLSKRTAEDAVRKFPRSYENWRLLSSISLSETGENKEIEATLRVLDPLNPNN
jgi:RecG-like helicase